MGLVAAARVLLEVVGPGIDLGSGRVVGSETEAPTTSVGLAQSGWATVTTTRLNEAEPGVDQPLRVLLLEAVRALAAVRHLMPRMISGTITRAAHSEALVVRGAGYDVDTPATA